MADFIATIILWTLGIFAWIFVLVIAIMFVLSLVEEWQHWKGGRKDG